MVLRSGTEKRTMDYPESEYKGRLHPLIWQNPPDVEVIGLLSDADNTNSDAMADYDDIQISN